MKVGILGTGGVGLALAHGFKNLGYEVLIGSREGKKIENWDGETGTFAEVAETSDLIVLAVRGMFAEGVVKDIANCLIGKTVIDATNPINKDIPPKDGVVQLFTGSNDSLMERYIKIAPEANFVKAFNTVGAELMVNPDFGGEKPTMFICGNSEEAKKEVEEILEKFGWDVEDLGTSAAAAPIEHFVVLWLIPGILKGDRKHSIKVLR